MGISDLYGSVSLCEVAVKLLPTVLHLIYEPIICFPFQSKIFMYNLIIMDLVKSNRSSTTFCLLYLIYRNFHYHKVIMYLIIY